MSVAGSLLVGILRTLVGAYPRWRGAPPGTAQSIYFANHTSHMDTLAIWAALPAPLRTRTRPVAARDYWTQGAFRRYLALKVLNVVLIERQREGREGDPLQPLNQALAAGESLILFPEGTRGHETLPMAFRSGLFHLATAHPQVNLVPVYLENLYRALPKGVLLPLPLICSVRFGAALPRVEGEDKQSFLERARAAVVALA